MSFMNASQVLLDVSCASKQDALELLSKKAAELGITDDADAVLKAFEVREEEGPTGMMDGFAVPHAKSDAIKEASSIVLRFTAPIEGWESIDGAPINMAIALLVPGAEAGTTHLHLLADIARALMDEEFRNTIRDAADPSEVSDMVNARLGA